MTDDGNTLVSSRWDATIPGRSVVVRWTQDLGVEMLGASDGRSTYPNAMTPDGSTIVGYSAPPGAGLQAYPVEGESPFMWRSDRGYRDVAELLASDGVDMDGWQLGAPGAVSAGGRVMIGNGRCDGLTTVYRLILPR